MIFTLTTLRDPGQGAEYRDKRTWGFYQSEIKALQAIVENTGNMMDCLYDYLVLEVYQPGVIAMAEREVWFQWKNNQWGLCKKPDFAEGLVNWAMG